MTTIARALSLAAVLGLVPAVAQAGEDSPRRKEAKSAVATLKAPDIAADHRGRMAAMSLAESAGLPEGLVNTIKAMAHVEPSMCGTLVAAALSETSEAAVKQRCGKGVDALRATVEKAALGSRAQALMSACKIKKVPEPAKLDAWSLLFSVVLKDLLAADAKSSPEEQELAEMVAYACPLPK